MGELIRKLLTIHEALESAGFQHAFGGAIALAYCTEEPRGTRDLDLNIFTSAGQAAAALAALPDGVACSASDIERVAREGQGRLWWDDTPIDVFLSNMSFHEQVGARVRTATLADREIPVLDCASLATFKAFFDRTKDWADLEAIAARDTAPLELAAGDIAELAGPDDPARTRLLRLIDEAAGTAAG